MNGSASTYIGKKHKKIKKTRQEKFRNDAAKEEVMRSR